MFSMVQNDGGAREDASLKGARAPKSRQKCARIGLVARLCVFIDVITTDYVAPLLAKGPEGLSDFNALADIVFNTLVEEQEQRAAQGGSMSTPILDICDFSLGH